MKLLLDSCVPYRAVAELRALGHEVGHVLDWDADPGDGEILIIARAQNQVLVTADKDFGQLAVAHRTSHAGIIRLVRIEAIRTATMVHETAQRYAEILPLGALVTVESDRTRVRPPEATR